MFSLSETDYSSAVTLIFLFAVILRLDNDRHA